MNGWRGTVVKRWSLAGKLSVIDLHLTGDCLCGQPTKPTQPLILSRSIKWAVSCNRISDLVAPSGECLWGEGLVWLNGAVVCSLAAVAGPIVR